MLLPPVVSLWKSDGEQWKAWSPRIVSARIKWMCGKRRTHLHIISCYAPTFVASCEEKNVFFDDLQQVLDDIPSDEPFVLLGDFNARVGTRQSTDDQSRTVRGPHGLSELNDAGKELLSFLSMNEGTICNMWAHSHARCTVREAKNRWFSKNTEEAQHERFTVERKHGSVSETYSTVEGG